MKLLFISSFFPPTHTGGTEIYTYTICHKLVEMGHDVHVLCVGKWDDGPYYWNGCSDEIPDGIPVRRVHLNWRRAADPNRVLYDSPVMAGLLRDCLAEFEPDLVHVTSCMTLSASILSVVREAGLPLILTLTDLWFLCPRLTLLRSDNRLCDGQTTSWQCLECMLRAAKSYRWLSRILPQSLVEKLLTTASKHPALNRQPSLLGMALDMEQRKRYLAAQLRLPDLVISPSKFLAAAFAFRETDRPFVIQTHGHDLSWLESFEGKSACSHVRLGYIGQVQPIKGVDVLLQAFLQLGEAADVSLDVWGGLEGNSAYIQEVCRLASASERIHLRGRYAHHDLADVLSEIDVIIMPSICYENSPLVIHEAFAAKIPVIATNLGGMRELVQHEVNGLLFERLDVEDLAHQMRRITAEPGLLEHLQEGIPPVKTVEQEVRELISIYQETIVANAKGGNR